MPPKPLPRELLRAIGAQLQAPPDAGLDDSRWFGVSQGMSKPTAGPIAQPKPAPPAIQDATFRGGTVPDAAYIEESVLNSLVPFAGSTKAAGAAMRSADDIRRAWKERGVLLDLFRSNSGDLNLDKIVVPKEMRGQGIGSQVMRDVNALADELGSVVRLSPSTDFGGSSVARLRAFYKRHGFVDNAGRNKDFTSRETMYRTPKQP